MGRHSNINGRMSNVSTNRNRVSAYDLAREVARESADEEEFGIAGCCNWKRRENRLERVNSRAQANKALDNRTSYTNNLTNTLTFDEIQRDMMRKKKMRQRTN